MSAYASTGLTCVRCGKELDRSAIFCSRLCFNAQRKEMRRARIVAKRLESPWIKRAKTTATVTTTTDNDTPAPTTPAKKKNRGTT